MDKPNNIILEGILGSKAYGLDHADSDEDIKGIFMEYSEEFLGLRSITETVDHVDPDWCYHELGKFCRLALAANPTILEQLFLPEYLFLDKTFGLPLVENRNAFLSNRVRNTYFGYAQQQMHRLQNRNDGSFKSKLRKRYEKHARHCARLLWQGKDLLETGTLVVDVSDKRDEIFAIGMMAPEELLKWFESEKDKFNTAKSVLPDEPEFNVINELVIDLRLML